MRHTMPLGTQRTGRRGDNHEPRHRLVRRVGPWSGQVTFGKEHRLSGHRLQFIMSLMAARVTQLSLRHALHSSACCAWWAGAPCARCSHPRVHPLLPPARTCSAATCTAVRPSKLRSDDGQLSCSSSRTAPVRFQAAAQYSGVHPSRSVTAQRRQRSKPRRRLSGGASGACRPAAAAAHGAAVRARGGTARQPRSRRRSEVAARTAQPPALLPPPCCCAALSAAPCELQPRRTSSRIASRWPSPAATWMGVDPTASCTTTSHPSDTSASMAATWAGRGRVAGGHG